MANKKHVILAFAIIALLAALIVFAVKEMLSAAVATLLIIACVYFLPGLISEKDPLEEANKAFRNRR